MSKKIKIGFDLGSNSLKIALLKGGKMEFQELPLPEHLMEEDTVAMPNAFSDFLKRVKKEQHLPKGPAAMLLPASQVICRLVSMPMMSVEQLMLNLPYEFSDFIRGESYQYHCDYALCEELPDAQENEDAPAGLTMMAAAVEKQQVQDYIRMFGTGGFSIKRILPQEMAIIQLVKAYRAEHADAPVEFCFIDLGYLSTRIFVIQGDRLQTVRRIPVGCRDLDSIVADILNIDQFLADSYKRSNHQEILDHPRCMEVYEHIAVETLKLVNFYHFTYRQNQLRGVYLIGGGANIQPLCHTLEETLGLPTFLVGELIPGVESVSQEQGTFAYAAGLILDSEEG